MAVDLPRSGERLVERDGSPTLVYYRFFQRLRELVSLSEVQAFFRALLLRLGSPDGTLDNLPPIATGSFLPKTTRIEGVASVFTDGVLSNGYVAVMLVNDQDLPAPTAYYGTDASGGKGWFPISAAFAAGVGITLTVDAGGVTTVALADLPDAGGGTLQKFARDAKGRVAGTSAATTSDLPEGGNLYFTQARVMSRVSLRF